MNVLVTGDTGLLGPYLLTAFTMLGQAEGVSTKQCDLTDSAAVKDFLSKKSPEVIVHAAALTDVEKCSFQPHLAMVHNVGMTENLVRYMPPECRFIYISTDSVYSGAGPHREHSRSENPINGYGMSKFMGEFAAAKARNHLIVRTNMYGKNPRGKGLLEFVLRGLKSPSFNVFTDVFFSPLWTATLASKLAVMARSRRIGTYNLGAATGMSKSKFAMLVADGLGIPFNGIPVESKSVWGKVARPLDTRMDIMKTEGAFALSLPSMESDIKAMCEHIKCTN